MKTNLFLALFVLPIFTFSSTKADNPDQIQVFDGTTLSVGDTIRFGYRQQYVNAYSAIKEYTNKNGFDQYVKVCEDLSLEEAVVLGINLPETENIFYTTNPVIVIFTKQYPKRLFVNLNEAIDEGDIAWIYKDHTEENAVELTTESMFACSMHVNNIPITDEIIKSFIKLKDERLYDVCTGDEFEYYKAKPIYEKMLKELMANFDFSKSYYIRTQGEIGKYDFAKNGYPVKFADSELIPHKQFYFLPTNLEHFNFIPVAFEDGERINKLRKKSINSTYVHPSVYVRVYLKLLDKKMALPWSGSYFEKFYRKSLIGTEIEKIEVYTFPNCDYNYIGSIVK